MKYNAREIFEKVVEQGGPNLLKDYLNTHYITSEDSLKAFYFPDWYVINEFYLREWAIWLEKVSEILDIKIGNTFYLDFKEFV